MVKLQALLVEARLADNVNPQLVRIAPDIFCESVGQANKIFMNTAPLSADWKHSFLLEAKGSPFPG